MSSVFGTSSGAVTRRGGSVMPAPCRWPGPPRRRRRRRPRAGRGGERGRGAAPGVGEVRRDQLGQDVARAVLDTWLALAHRLFLPPGRGDPVVAGLRDGLVARAGAIAQLVVDGRDRRRLGV